MQLTESTDLRGGRHCWVADELTAVASEPLPTARVDVAIVGAGVMGAMLAERLATTGRSVALVDRRPPAHGSTAASTALVMWGADVPLTHLAATIGLDEAARRWRRVHAAVWGLARRIDADSIDAARADRPELYLTGTLLDEAQIDAEGVARREAGLPSVFLPAEQVAQRFGIAARAALLSAGSFEVDPVKLTRAMLERARRCGATATFPCDVVAIEEHAAHVRLAMHDGATLDAGQVVLATGYERATWFLPPQFTLSSSYAIATRPGTAPLWHENALIWEASDSYLYARATADGRILAGGGDEDFSDPVQRDALIGAKSGAIAADLAATIDVESVAVDCAWAATFGSSPDGLPAIGRAAGRERLWLASGFGGNGVSFAALAAELIAADLDGTPDPDASCFDPYRFA